VILLSYISAHGQITPSQDAYTNSTDPTTNYGAKTLLDVDGATQITYIQFNLASTPSGASVSQATLKLYVNAVTTAGSFNVDYVNGAWAEATITHNMAPALGTTIASNVSIPTADKNQYILIDITLALQAWLNGNQANDGLALVANGSFNASFDSKENKTTSHPPEIDVVYAGGGTITGVLTGSGSGLTGGGTSGTLNLSLTTACASKQVLQWSGSAWACNNAGTGTITGVNAGTDLTGGGNGGTVTLNLDTAKVPQLATANTFTGNQTVNGNLSATGVVTGSSYQIGSNLFAFGSYGNQNAFIGFAGNTTTTGYYNTASGYQALLNNTTGLYNMANGTEALLFNTTGTGNTASGSQALQGNGTGAFNTASGYQALILNSTGNDNTAAGYQALYGNKKGTDNTASGFQALYYNLVSGGTAIGSQALMNNSTGVGNTASGYQALYSNSTGGYNTANGYQALQSNTTGGDNTASGIQALQFNTTGGDNTANGFEALQSNTTGGDNTANGYDALASNTTGRFNAAAGSGVLVGNTTGNDNTASGTWALFSNTTGNDNTAVGFQALYTNTTGNGNTCVGYDCGIGANGIFNATAIGAHAVVSQSNSLVLGGTAEYAVKVGIGTTSPSNVLTIARGAGHPVSDSWETYSSLRWKQNIQTLPDALSKVKRLRGVSYDLKNGGKHEIGVIAEEVGAIVPEVVSYEANGKDASGVDYGRLTAVLIEAVKQQQREIAVLRSRTAKLESTVAQLKKDQRAETRMASVQANH
jgi:hypothetical protein